MSKEIFEESFEKLLNVVDNKITLTNLVNIITRAVEVVESYNNITGPEKKHIAVNIVIALIEKYEPNESLRQALISLLNSIGGPIIDALILATKGKLAINIKNSCIKKLNCFTS